MQPDRIIATFESEFVSPAALRNRAPLLDALQARLPQTGIVLEVAAGALTHALALSAAHPTLSWLPTEVDTRILDKVNAYLQALDALDQRPANLLTPVQLDVTTADWPVAQVDSIYTANLLHISPPSCSAGLFRGAGEHLKPHGRLFIYGPFRVADRFTSDGDVRFDASLKARNPRWGIRDLEPLIDEARRRRLQLVEQLPMPANNWLLTFEAAPLATAVSS